MKHQVTIIETEFGNRGSLANMLRHIGVDYAITPDPDLCASAERLILPGVGAWGNAAKFLDSSGLREAITAAAANGAAVLGICLGMQLLFDSSEEGAGAGLSLIPGAVKKIEPAHARERIPHMGWEETVVKREHPVMAACPSDSRFYFAHSYRAVEVPDPHVLATIPFGGETVAVAARDNVIGAQFHPEKSHRFGMAFLGAFAEWTP